MGEEKYKKVKVQNYKLPADIKLDDVCIDNSWLERAVNDHAYDAMRYAVEDIRRTTTAYNHCYAEKKAREIERVIFSDKMTIVLWGDGTKTMVKCDEKEFDHEKGLAMAIAKKFLGTNKSKSNYYDVFKKWVPNNEDLTISFGIDMQKAPDFGERLMHALGIISKPTKFEATGKITKAPEEAE